MKSNQYQLIDSGLGNKLEAFGPYLLSRPAAQAAWRPESNAKTWDNAHAVFDREGGKKWTLLKSIPEEWTVEISNIFFKLKLTDFGHLGVFPEQKPFWTWIQNLIAEEIPKRKTAPSVLNLFAYSGGSTLAAAKAGAEACHLDASKGMVAWARENAALNGLSEAPIRWIVDDVQKFLQREIRRGKKYDAIILDPPTFGRGAKGEIFKIEEDLITILEWCRKLLSDKPLFILFSCHTPGYSPTVLHHLLSQTVKGLGGTVDSGEMSLEGIGETFPLPSGSFARWTHGS